MKVVMTKAEVEQLVLEIINQRMSTNFNKCEIDTYRYTGDFAVISHEEPEQPAAEE